MKRPTDADRAAAAGHAEDARWALEDGDGEGARRSLSKANRAASGQPVHEPVAARDEPDSSGD